MVMVKAKFFSAYADKRLISPIFYLHRTHYVFCVIFIYKKPPFKDGFNLAGTCGNRTHLRSY